MMHFKTQKILPATSNLKEFEHLMQSNYNYIVLLESHIAQLHALKRLADQHDKKILLHVDLIQGLRSDEYAVDYLSQIIKPAGIISTRKNVVTRAKKKSLIAIQRIFLLDTHALNTSLRLLEQSRLDYIEVLPGIVPNLIREISLLTDVPILTGGFIRKKKEVLQALGAGAVAVTTSDSALWKMNW